MILGPPKLSMPADEQPRNELHRCCSPLRPTLGTLQSPCRFTEPSGSRGEAGGGSTPPRRQASKAVRTLDAVGHFRHDAGPDAPAGGAGSGPGSRSRADWRFESCAGRYTLLTKPRQSFAVRSRRFCDDALRRAAGFAAGWLAAGIAACAGIAHAEDSATLTVKPVLCVADRREEGCPLSLTVSWRSEQEGNYCLYSGLAEEPIRCWENAAAGTIVEERVVRETFSYWLTNGANAKLAEATVELVTTESDDRRRHRRRRHVWDIL